MGLTGADIKAMVSPGMVEDLARELAPGGRRSGNYWITKSPLRMDRSAGSFAVWVRGPAAGGWKDYAADDKGDLIDLIAEVKYGGRSREARGKAIQFLKAKLGLANVSPKEVAEMRRRAALAAAERDEAEQRAREAKRRRAQGLWLDGKPLGGTVGETYLRSRGIEAAGIPNRSMTFRFLPSLAYWKGGEAWRGPAIVGRYRSVTGEAPAIHGTWLREDGGGKAPLSPAKLSLGEYKGCFLPITRGIAGREVWEADCPGGPLAVTEGPEDGWSIALAMPDLRVWAAGSLSNIGNLPHAKAISSYLVVRQNDWDTPAAVDAFERQIEKLKRHGVPVEEIGVALGKDPNDQLRGRP